MGDRGAKDGTLGPPWNGGTRNGTDGTPVERETIEDIEREMGERGKVCFGDAPMRGRRAVNHERDWGRIVVTNDKERYETGKIYSS